MTSLASFPVGNPYIESTDADKHLSDPGSSNHGYHIFFKSSLQRNWTPTHAMWGCLYSCSLLPKFESEVGAHLPTKPQQNQRAPDTPEFAQPHLRRSAWHRPNTSKFVASRRGSTSNIGTNTPQKLYPLAGDFDLLQLGCVSVGLELADATKA